MKRRLKWKLIALLAVLASLLLLGGCKFQYTLDEVRDKYNLPVSVTYYTNGTGAYFGVDETEKTLYLPAGKVAMDIGDDTVKNGSIPTPTRTNYTLVDWYEAELDENGEPKKDENGEIVLKAEPYDFSTRLEAGTELALYAKWQKNEAVYVYLVCDEIDENGFEIKDSSGNAVAVENEGKLGEYSYPTDGIRYEPSAPTAEGYTWVSYYEDKECTVEATWPVRQSEKGDYTVYAKYIKGNWRVIKTEKNLQAMFNATGAANYYLARDIECTGTVNKIANFSGVLKGNGYTIKNLTVNGGTLKTSNVTVSTFGNLKDGASIEDVTFENLTFNVTMGASNAIYVNAFFLFGSIADTASVNGVQLKGSITMDIEREKTAIVGNMWDATNSVWHKAHLFFGDGDNLQTTDETMLTKENLNVTFDDEAVITVTMDTEAVG